LTQLLRQEFRRAQLDCNESQWRIHLTMSRCLSNSPDLAKCRDRDGAWRCNPVGSSDCQTSASEHAV
jgi:hypothetical protein